MLSADLLREAVALARSGQKERARDILLKLVDKDPHNEMAWIWLTGLVDDLDDKIIACENVLTINPDNEKVRLYLGQLLAQHNELATEPPLDDPTPTQVVAPQRTTHDFVPNRVGTLEMAKQYEEEGKVEEALNEYRSYASTVKDSREFDRIYKEILRLEKLQKENIQYVAPSSSIIRMAFGWPLLYASLVFVQAGGTFFLYPAWYLWLGIPFVAFGSFLIALSEVKARHPIWKAMFAEENTTGTAFARFTAGSMGWLLVIFPHLLLVADSVMRMQHFQIPPLPF